MPDRASQHQEPREIQVHFAGGAMVREVGDASAVGGSVLWIHGLGESGLCFEHLLRDPRLANYHHICPDLVGYGRSPWTETPLRLPEHGQLALRVAAEIVGDERPVILVGHSMGGVIGQFVCEQAPERVSIFVNVEGNLSLGDCGYSSRAQPFSLAQFEQTGSAEVGAQIEEAGATDPAHRSYSVSYRLCRPAAFHRNAAELVELSQTEQLAARFARLPHPKAFAQGKPDGAPPRSTELLVEAGIEPKLFEPAGHWPFIDQPDAFVRWLAERLGALV